MTCLSPCCMIFTKKVKSKLFLWDFINSVPSDIISDWSKLKAIADVKINVTQKLKFGSERMEKKFRKRRKCWYPTFSPFSTMFFKAFFPRLVKTRDCFVSVYVVLIIISPLSEHLSMYSISLTGTWQNILLVPVGTCSAL